MSEKLYPVKDYEGIYAITKSGKVWSYHLNRWRKKDVIEIIKLRKEGLKLFEIAKQIGTTISTVGNIVNKHTWKHLIDGKLVEVK